MDLASEELQFLSIPDMLKESVSIPKQSPKTFYLITLTLIFPLSFAILAHSLFTHPIISQLQSDPIGASSDWSKLLIFQFFYLLFVFAFSLLSTAAVVFTVASLYTCKVVSFSSTISAIPSVFKRWFITFLWVSLSMIVYNIIFLAFLLLLVFAVDTENVFLLIFSMVIVFVLFLVVHVYISALWHLASVVSVLEPVYGFAAMKKSYQLLKGMTGMGFVLVFGYLAVCGVINALFGSIVVHAGGDYGVLTRRIIAAFRWKTWRPDDILRFGRILLRSSSFLIKYVKCRHTYRGAHWDLIYPMPFTVHSITNTIQILPLLSHYRVHLLIILLLSMSLVHASPTMRQPRSDASHSNAHHSGYFKVTSAHGQDQVDSDLVHARNNDHKERNGRRSGPLDYSLSRKTKFVEGSASASTGPSPLPRFGVSRSGPISYK